MLYGIDFAVAYLEDILLKIENQDENKKNIFEVFRMIPDYRFKLNDEKGDFLKNKFKYLGQIIDRNCRRTDPERFSAIKDIPFLENISP